MRIIRQIEKRFGFKGLLSTPARRRRPQTFARSILALVVMLTLPAALSAFSQGHRRGGPNLYFSQRSKDAIVDHAAFYGSRLATAPPGEGQFYKTDGGGNISFLGQQQSWRNSWDPIVTGDFGGSFNYYTDLLFYDHR